MSFRVDAEALARTRSAFEKNFERGLECGAALSVWQDGKERLHLFRGLADPSANRPWAEDTLVLVWSATKGPSSACALLALHEAGIGLDEPVSGFWPEFSAGGKARITVADVLSHRAGLAALRDHGPKFLDHGAVAAALAAQAPLWEPRSAHGYGPRVFGYLLEEIVRRTAGIPLSRFWAERFAGPLGLDFYIGLPEPEHARAAKILPPRLSLLSGEKTAFMRAFTDPGSLTYSAFSTPGGLTGPSAMNSPALRSASLPSLGGIGSARALAKFYSALACGEKLLGNAAPAALARPVANGSDLVLQLETAFSCGFMFDPMEGSKKVRESFGPSPAAFGHPGAGGSLAFADPENRIAFAYVMNQMEPGAMPRERTRSLVRALYGV